MHKRLIISCMAISAFMALVVAPAASASPVLTEEGSALAVGSSILAKNTGSVVFAGAFNSECNTAEMVGTLTSNSGGVIQAEIPVGGAKITGTGTSGDCTSSLGAIKVTVNSKICESSVAGTDTSNLTGCGGNIVFTLEITGTGACKYAAASATGTFVTGGDATLNVKEQPFSKTEGGILCPSSGKLTVDFDQTTTDGKTLLIS